MTKKPNLLVRLGRLIRGAFTVVRTLLQLIVLLVLVAVLVNVFQGSAVQVPESGALVLAPTGLLVDELAGDAIIRAFNDAQGVPPQETLVKDLVDALDAAADDDRIQAVVLSLGGLQGGGLSKLREVAKAIVQFRDTGKPVIAMGDAYSQAQYYLAAHADEVYLHQFGNIFLDGFGYFRTYYREALEEKYVLRRKVRDIAAERALTEKALESLLTRARHAFRQTFLALARNLDVEIQS